MKTKRIQHDKRKDRRKLRMSQNIVKDECFSDSLRTTFDLHIQKNIPYCKDFKFLMPPGMFIICSLIKNNFCSLISSLDEILEYQFLHRICELFWPQTRIHWDTSKHAEIKTSKKLQPSLKTFDIFHLNCGSKLISTSSHSPINRRGRRHFLRSHLAENCFKLPILCKKFQGSSS